MKAQLVDYIRAGYGGLAFTTPEYIRCRGTILKAAQETNSRIFDWDARGVVMNDHTGRVEADELDDIDEILAHITTFINQDTEDGHVIWIITDAHLFFQDVSPVTVALMRDTIQHCKSARHHIILLGASFKLSPEVEKLFTQIDFALPTKEELAEILNTVAENAGVELSGDEVDKIAIAASGMTSVEAEDAFALSYATTKKDEGTGRFCPQLICREKARVVERSGYLKYIDERIDMSSVGGLENGVSYIELRKHSFSAEAREYGCPTPKGIVLVGAPGTGKSLFGKCIASVLDRPFLMLDAGALYGGLVGESEGNTRTMIKTVEAVAPCVLMID